PLRIYAFLEVGIGVFGVVALFLIPLVGRAYAAGPVSGVAGLILRGFVAAVCLLPPTFLMGASLPAIARWVESTQQGLSWLGHLYSANVAGAVIGCLLAGFYLLRVFDMGVATYTAAAINIGVAAVALAMAARTASPSGAKADAKIQRAAGANLVSATI